MYNYLIDIDAKDDKNKRKNRIDMAIEIELNKDKITAESRYLNISHLCESCADRMACDFIKEIKSFFRYRKYTDCITDVQVDVFSCNNYEREIPNMRDNDNVCIYCKTNCL